MAGIKSIKTSITKAALSCSIAILFTLNTSNVQAATIKDMNSSSDYARDAISVLASKSVIDGDSSGNFNPLKTITRAEMITLFVRALGINTANEPANSTFKDVPKNHWAFKYVEAAYREGIVNGVEPGVFGEKALCTREQMATIFMRSLGVESGSTAEHLEADIINNLSDRGEIAEWAKEPVQFALSTGLMQGTSDVTFNPKGNAKREQVAVVINRFLNNKTNVSNFAAGLKDIKISINGDKLNVNEKPVIENGEIFVPVKLVDYMREPGTVTLTVAPRLINNVPMVSAKAVEETLGAKFVWDEKGKTLGITDNTLNKYPNLYNALKNTRNFKGEFKTKFDVNLKQESTNESMKMEIDMEGKATDGNSHSKVNILVGFSGMPDESMQYEVLKVGSKAYGRAGEGEQWEEAALSDIRNSGTFFMDMEKDTEESDKLIEKFNQLPVSKAGEIILNGKLATKYVITMDSKDITTLLPEGYLASPVDLNQVYGDGLLFKLEYYVDKQNRIIKTTTVFNGEGTEEDEKIMVNLLMDVEFNHIDGDVVLEAPSKEVY